MDNYQPTITESMLDAGIDALEEIAGITCRRGLAADVYTAMELARLNCRNPAETDGSLLLGERVAASNTL